MTPMMMIVYPHAWDTLGSLRNSIEQRHFLLVEMYADV